MSGQVDVEPNHIPQLLGKPGIIREFELAIAMRLEAMNGPDAPHGTGADAGLLGHHGGGPVGCLDRRISQRQGDHPPGNVRAVA